MLCHRCGHTSPPGSRFCSACGSPLDALRDTATDTAANETGLIPVVLVESTEEEVAVAAADVPEGQGVLVVKRGPNAGSRFVLVGGAVTAGRSPDSDIFLDDVTVSRHHANFVPSGTSYEVRDVGSLNGTYLNRERIDMAILANGDEVQIGKFRLVFLTGASN